MVVFFAAGAMEWGSGDDLENSGQGLGGKPGWRDVVLVTLNYRKGIFGFLAADELRARDERKAPALGLATCTPLGSRLGPQNQILGLDIRP